MRSRTRLVESLLALFAVLAIASPWGRSAAASGPSTPAQDTAWEVSCVDCAKDMLPSSDRALRLDAAGHPHIAYGGDHLYYAWHDGTAWRTETADPAAGVGAYASLVLDGEGNPYISYYLQPHYLVNYGTLKYAHRNSAGVWTIRTVAAGSENDTVRYSAIGLDGSGRPCIAYGQHFLMSHGELRYTCLDGDAWETPQVVYMSPILEVGRLSLAFDSQGRPHVAYYNSKTIEDRLKYSYYVGPGQGNCWPEYNWNCEDVEANYGGGMNPSLALDSQDRPHISYDANRYATWWLKYASWNGIAWDMEWIGEDGRTGSSSLALDGQDRPRIAYVRAYDPYYDNSAFRLAAWTGSRWDIQTIKDHITDNRTGSLMSLALDAAGNAHVSYQEPSGLGHLYGDGSAWTDEQVAPGIGSIVIVATGRHNSLALDAAGRPRVAYCGYNAPDPCLNYASWNDALGQWDIQQPLAGTPGPAGEYPSLALDAAGSPHISYMNTNDDYEDLVYLYRDGSGWLSQVVDDRLVMGLHTELKLDASGRPHIAYTVVASTPQGSAYALTYAAWTGSAWLTQTVAPSVWQDNFSLALDAAGRPHIAYTPYGAYEDAVPTYAYLEGASWLTRTIDGPDCSGAGGGLALALDAAGVPHIAYSACGSPGRIMYAVWTGSEWAIEEVDQFPYIGTLYYLDLALDAGDHPHISYTTGEGGLKYAAWTGSEWRRQAVCANHEVWHNSLALDAQGLTHITYLDTADGDLYIARQTLPPLTLSKRARPVDGLQAGHAVTLTLDLGSAGLTAAFYDPLPAGLTYVPGSLTGTVSPAPTYDAGQGAVRWQGALGSPPQTITFRATLDTAQSIVNRAWLTDTVHARTVSAAVILNPRRVYLPVVVK